MAFEELQAVATKVTVPGSPLTLELGWHHDAPGEEPRVSWSFDDPFEDGEVLVGTTAVRGSHEEVWRQVQLDAAWVFVLHVDGDWVPGVPVVRRRWGTDEAWAALLRHLGSDGSEVEVDGDEVRGRHMTLRGVTPDSFAALLNDVTDVEPPEVEDPDWGVVPAGEIEGDDLPTWLRDELDFGFGDVTALRLTHGRLHPDPPRP